MNNNEKLIEEVAKVLEDQSPMRYSRWPTWVWMRLARAALAVFEKAHTPTDDEREVLLAEADALVASWDQKGSWSSDSPVGMVMRLAADLRRSEAPKPSTVGKETLDKAIWWAVVQECQGQLGGEPHATTWARGGYRNDVPTLCDRCARLIETLRSLVALRAAGEVAR